MKNFRLSLTIPEQLESDWLNRSKNISNERNRRTQSKEPHFFHVSLSSQAIKSDKTRHDSHDTCLFCNPLNPELNPICYLLALLGAHHFLHVSRIRVKSLTFRRLMSYIYKAPILDVSRSHTTTQHSR